MNRSGRESGLQRAADELKEQLGRFAGRPRFNEEFELAFDFYFGHGIGEDQLSLSEADFERFMEWFVHDYPMANGHSLIEIFDLEHGAELSVAGRRLLRRWRRAHLSLLEVVEGEGERWRLADLLTGRILEPVRIPGRPPARWSLIVGRPLPVGKGYELSGAYTLLPPGIKESLLDHLRGEFRRYRQERGDLRVERFLRENGHCFNDLLGQLEEEIAAAEEREERAYRLVRSQAVFEARDPASVTARLLEWDDISEVRPGRMLLRDNEGRTLAEISCTNGRMQVQCWSRERLEACKALLTHRLDGLVRHLLDAYQDTVPNPELGTSNSGTYGRGTSLDADIGSNEYFASRNSGGRDSAVGGSAGEDSASEDSASGDSASRNPDSARRTTLVQSDLGQSSNLSRSSDCAPGEDVAAQACEETIETWLESPHPALGCVSPMQLASSKLGRVRVAELLKQMEYRLHSRFGERGDRAISELRRRLGLDSEAGFLVPLNRLPEIWNRESERTVIDELVRLGEDLTVEQIDSALWMWWSYRSYTSRAIRKPQLWAAALHACIAFVEDCPITHEEIAARFEVSPASVSETSWKIIDRLGLHIFDPRYCTFQRECQPGSRASREGTGEVENGRLVDDALWQRVSTADRLREQMARVFDSQVTLRQRAYAFYSSHVGSRRAIEWEEAFLDWFHLDWHVPVMGGRTLVEVALESDALSAAERETLAAWIGCHPSFYVVKGVEHGVGPGNGRPRPTPKLTLIDVVDGSVTAVDWLRLSNPVVPGDVLFARLIPVDGATVSLGPVLGFPPRFKEIFRQALIEDRALVERWNGRALPWDEFRARYAERLYALALQSVSDGGADFYED